MSTNFVDVGDCWTCDTPILIPAKHRDYADSFQMLFCCQECADQSSREKRDYGRGLIIKLSAEITPK